MTRWLDSITGRVTMYRLVVYVLGALALITIGLSLIPGGFAFSPLQLLASLAVALVVTVLAGQVVALPFRAKPHLESSIITGLLLFFLFFPTTDATRLATLALVAVIASLSKYVLAFRGRHIFNPVAIAAVIIAFTQVSAAVWWVGTPFLLLPVLLGGFLVVWRIRRFALVGTFVIVAAVISITRLTLGGAELGAALSITLASSPIFFFALFMLDEPLTLAPRRWQQLSLAVVAAVIMEVPFSFGLVYNSPELGLVVANLVAFFFGQRRSVRLEFRGIRALTPSTRELVFAAGSPLSFRPGQYLELALPHSGADSRGVRRTFSVASAPGAQHVAIGLKMPETASSFKRAIIALEPGTMVRATAVGGDFVLPRDTTIPVLLVAGGIGITPFISQLRDLAAGAEQRDIVLVYAVTDAGELAYADEIRASGVPVLVVGPSAPAGLPPGWQYLGSGRLDSTMLADRVPRLTARTAYVSGPPGLVTSLTRDLRALGIRRVRSDYFSGY